MHLFLCRLLYLFRGWFEIMKFKSHPEGNRHVSGLQFFNKTILKTQKICLLKVSLQSVLVT